jgi:hypothetical protein
MLPPFIVYGKTAVEGDIFIITGICLKNMPLDK